MASKTLTKYVDDKLATRPSPHEFGNVALAQLLARAGRHTVDAYQEVGAAAIIRRHIVTQPMRLASVVAKALVAGTAAGPTTIMVKKIAKGAVAAASVDCLASAISIAHDSADGAHFDGELHGTSANLDFAVGDELVIEVTAAATNLANLAVSAELEPLIDA